MSSRQLALLGVTVALFTPASVRESAGCTLFYAAKGDIVLGGNNEDWHVPLTKIWFIPRREGRHGVAYVTFGDHRAIQGGMNDQGLFFDFLAVKPRDVKATPDKPRWNAHPLREVMERCATVDEAVAMLEAHNRAFMRRVCIFLGDATGTSAIVEAEAVVRKKGTYQVATNFRQSLTPPKASTCWRYRTANRMLSQADEINVDLFRQICAAVHQEGKNSTLYSTVYDLKRKVIYLYHFHNFDNVVVFDLEKELAKGERVVDMPNLFPSNSAYERFQRGAATQTRPQPTDVKQRDKAPTKAATGGVTTPDWIITQDAVNDWSVRNVATGKIAKSRDPIADVYGADRWSTASRNRQPMKSPGDVIVMRPGEYPHSRITLTYDVNEGVAHGMKNNDRILPKDVSWGRDPMTVIRAEKPGSVLIRTNPVGGSQTLYLEWAGAIRLEGLTFQGSSPMGIGTENPKASQGEWQGFRDIEFVQCSVRGERDFETNVGPRNKWGMLSYALGRSARGDQTPGFRWSGGATPDNADDWDIEGIHLEHAMYHHNVIANNRDAFAMLIEDLRIRWCGRTAFQMVARTGEGADGIGKVVLRNLEIEDVCLEEGGGGSALTFAGNHDGKVLIDNVTVRLGANPRLHPAYSRNITGAFVSYAGGGSEGRPTREIVVTGCHFEVGPHFVGEGSARRPNVNVAAVKRFCLLNTTIVSHADASAALQIDPDSVGQVCLDADNRVVGDCRWGAQLFTDPKRDGSGYANMLHALRDHPKVRITRDDP